MHRAKAGGTTTEGSPLAVAALPQAEQEAGIFRLFRRAQRAGTRSGNSSRESSWTAASLETTYDHRLDDQRFD